MRVFLYYLYGWAADIESKSENANSTIPIVYWITRYTNSVDYYFMDILVENF